MAYAPPRGRLPSIEWVPLAELLVDDSYQRSIDTNASRRLIREIASEWDWDVLDVLKVSRRPDDRLFLVDGQHRRAAAELRGDIHQLPCVLKRCAGPAEEARLFIAANRGRKKMSRIDDFRAAIGAGDADALAIDRAVTTAGFAIARHDVARNLRPGELICIGALKSQLQRFGEERLAEALRLMGEAFPDEVLASPGAMSEALLELAGEIDPDTMFDLLLAGTTAEWAEWAGGTENRSHTQRKSGLKRVIRHRHAGRRVAA